MSISTTVWMIHRFTNPRTGVRGNLTLDEGVLRFVPASGGAPTSIRVEDVEEVDRVAASPVMTLRLGPSHRLPEILFYFVEPPYMFGKSTKITLRVADAFLHDEVSEWVQAIEGAVQGTWDEPEQGDG
jgi:hypothetical protein